jgi:hypothetical protein
LRFRIKRPAFLSIGKEGPMRYFSFILFALLGCEEIDNYYELDGGVEFECEECQDGVDGVDGVDGIDGEPGDPGPGTRETYTVQLDDDGYAYVNAGIIYLKDFPVIQVWCYSPGSAGNLDEWSWRHPDVSISKHGELDIYYPQIPGGTCNVVTIY